MKKQISIIDYVYVGLVTGACFAKTGNKITWVEFNNHVNESTEKINR